MSAALYPSAISAFNAGSLVWTGSDIRALLLSEPYTYRSTDSVVADIPVPYRIAFSEPLEEPTVVGDSYTGKKPFFWLPASIVTAAYHVIIAKNTGNESTSKLIGYWGPDRLVGSPIKLNPGYKQFLYPAFSIKGFFQVIRSQPYGAIGSMALGTAVPLGLVTNSAATNVPPLFLGPSLSAPASVAAPMRKVR